MSGGPEDLSAAQLRQAQQGGFRGRSRALELGLRFGVAATVLGGAGAQLPHYWHRQFVDSLFRASELSGPPVHAAVEASQHLSSGLFVLLTLALALALGIILLAALLTRTVGPLRGRLRSSSPTIVLPTAWRLGLASAATVVALVALRGVLAGAARASTASLKSLSLLWGMWLVHLLSRVAVLLIVVGVVEWILARVHARRRFAERQREMNHAAGVRA